MNEINAQKIRESTKNTLKTIYYVIIGIAITEALYRTFVKQENAENFFTALIQLLIFLPTAIRFTHGASIHIDKEYDKRRVIVINFIFFYIQSLLFYIMTLWLEDSILFLSYLLAMLVSDAVWILIMICKKYEILEKTHKQWLLSDLIFLLLIIIILILLPFYFFLKFACLILIMFYSFIATWWDYHSNGDHYFPKKN